MNLNFKEDKPIAIEDWIPSEQKPSVQRSLSYNYCQWLLSNPFHYYNGNKIYSNLNLQY